MTAKTKPIEPVDAEWERTCSDDEWNAAVEAILPDLLDEFASFPVTGHRRSDLGIAQSMNRNLIYLDDLEHWFRIRGFNVWASMPVLGRVHVARAPVRIAVDVEFEP